NTSFLVIAAAEAKLGGFRTACKAELVAGSKAVLVDQVLPVRGNAGSQRVFLCLCQQVGGGAGAAGPVGAVIRSGVFLELRIFLPVHHIIFAHNRRDAVVAVIADNRLTGLAAFGGDQYNA